MQIFFLDRFTRECASYLCDIHVNKMAIETAQILSSAASLRGTYREGMYKPAWLHHPCVTWAAETVENYFWTASLLECILDEFINRYGFFHKSTVVLNQVYQIPEMVEALRIARSPRFSNQGVIGRLDITTPPIAISNEFYKDYYKGLYLDEEEDEINPVINTYRLYYAFEKMSKPWAVYKRFQGPPHWANELLKNNTWKAEKGKTISIAGNLTQEKLDQLVQDTEPMEIVPEPTAVVPRPALFENAEDAEAMIQAMDGALAQARREALNQMIVGGARI